MIMIKITDKQSRYNVSTYEEPGQRAFDDIYDIVGDELTPDGIPLAIEISSWAELACLGEVWENERIRVEPVETDFS